MSFKKTNKSGLGDFLNVAKKWDSETALWNNRDCETQMTANIARLGDPWNSTKILQDQRFLEEHLAPLINNNVDKISVLVSETKLPNYMYCQFRNEWYSIALQERHYTMVL